VRNGVALPMAIAVLMSIAVLCAGYFFASVPEARPIASSVPQSSPALSSSGPLIPASLVETSDTPVRGPVGAPLTIHVIADLQCPFCWRVQRTLADIDEAHPGAIRWVWHDYPQSRIHPMAELAAQAAREVRRQLGDEAFWAYQHQVFLWQVEGLDRPRLEAIAERVPGIDLERFRHALDTHEHEAAVLASAAAVDAAHVAMETPAFLIGEAWVVGVQPLERYGAEVDRRLGR